MSQRVFINFSGSIDGVDPSLSLRQKILNITAKKFAHIDKTIAWTRQDILHTEFYKNNKEILDSPRGAGYWAWKPYIILETLKQAKPDDWVIYCDVGKPFRRGDPERNGNTDIGNAMYTPIDALIDYAIQQDGFTPGVWIPHYGLAHVWTKRDCFVVMSCDSAEFHNAPHVQAGYSAWSKSDASIAFLEEWLSWCCNPTAITDADNILGKPNSKNFRDHRHDQAILSNLVIKKGIQPFGPKERSLNGYRNFNLIIRHMMLAGALKNLRQQFSTLFNSSELPAFSKEFIELLFLSEIGSNNSVELLLQAEHDILKWQHALPNASIDFLTQDNRLPQQHKQQKQFDGIFISRAQQQHLSRRVFANLYHSLKPGGFLFVGPYKGNKNDSPSTTGTFSEFIAWLHLHQCFPQDCGANANQRPHALTSGSIVNPIVTYLNNDKTCYAAMVKPKMYLPDLLTSE